MKTIAYTITDEKAVAGALDATVARSSDTVKAAAGATSGADVLAVLDRMRNQASFGRCCDVKITAQGSIQHIDEDRNAVAAITALIVERDAYRDVLREFQDGRRISNPHTRQVARDIEQQAIARASAATGGGNG